MRYLRNPHWDPKLRPGTGLDADVSAYVAADPAYETTVAQIETLLLTLLPRYRAEGKSYVTIAFGCTGGRHRSVHVAERVAGTLRAAGHAPNLLHRNLDSAPQDALVGRPAPASGGKALGSPTACPAIRHCRSSEWFSSRTAASPKSWSPRWSMSSVRSALWRPCASAPTTIWRCVA